MRIPIIFTSLAFAAAIAVTVSTDGSASTSIALTLDDLARDAEVIARVTALDRTSAWTEGRIVTSTRVRVDGVLGGQTAGDVVTVRSLGGVVDGVGQRVEGEPELTPGATAFVFLKRTGHGSGDAMRVVGRAQGRWLVARDGAREVVHVRDAGMLVTRGPLVPRGPLAPRGKLATELDGVSTQAASLEIASAWRSTHAR